MDSVTQFALGATVGTAVLGRRVGARSGIIIGGLLGTLPDLDVFVPVADPVASFIGHRGATHSLIVHTLVTPLISEALVRSFAKLRNIRPLAYAAVFFLTYNACVVRRDDRIRHTFVLADLGRTSWSRIDLHY